MDKESSPPQWPCFRIFWLLLVVGLGGAVLSTSIPTPTMAVEHSNQNASRHKASDKKIRRHKAKRHKAKYSKTRYRKAKHRKAKRRKANRKKTRRYKVSHHKASKKKTIRKTVLDPALNAALREARQTLQIGSKYYKVLDSFYLSRGYKPAWTNASGLTNSGKFLHDILALVQNDGLDPAGFPLPKKDLTNPQSLDDIKLSFSLVRYAEQVQAGRVAPGDIVTQFDLKPNHPDLLALLHAVHTGKNPSVLLARLPPPHKQYRLLKSRLAAIHERMQSLVSKKQFVDIALLNAARKITRQQKNLIIANMERWRWVPRSLGTKYIWVNLPSYKLLIKEEGRTTFITKGIIGRVSAPTPLISSTIKNIIINPFWHIPASVVASDIMPKLKKDPVEYLASQSIKVLRRGGRIIDPAKINWADITNPRTYRFRQSPGDKNALGQMKVLFPNSHSIYLHDTNEPELFAFENRAFSHGCIRLANPIGFADTIASFDSHLQSQMPGTLLGKREHWLKYKKQLPVHLVYFTAEIDRFGRFITHPDIYRYDDKLLQLFKARQESRRLTEI